MSKNDDSTKNGKGKLDFSKLIPSESSICRRTKGVTTCSVRKPSKQQFVRVCSQEFGQFECASSS